MSGAMLDQNTESIGTGAHSHQKEELDSQLLNQQSCNSLVARTSAEIPYNRVAGNAIVKRALHWVGRGTYTWASCTPEGKFDCSGFVSYALTGRYDRRVTTQGMANNASLYPVITVPYPGDIVFYNDPNNPGNGHCGIYYMHNMMIECRNNRNVIIEEIDFDVHPYHYRRYLGDSQ